MYISIVQEEGGFNSASVENSIMVRSKFRFKMPLLTCFLLCGSLVNRLPVIGQDILAWILQGEIPYYNILSWPGPHIQHFSSILPNFKLFNQFFVSPLRLTGRAIESGVQFLWSELGIKRNYFKMPFPPVSSLLLSFILKLSLPGSFFVAIRPFYDFIFEDGSSPKLPLSMLISLPLLFFMQILYNLSTDNILTIKNSLESIFPSLLDYMYIWKRSLDQSFADASNLDEYISRFKKTVPLLSVEASLNEPKESTHRSYYLELSVMKKKIKSTSNIFSFELPSSFDSPSEKLFEAEASDVYGSFPSVPKLAHDFVYEDSKPDILKCLESVRVQIPLYAVQSPFKRVNKRLEVLIEALSKVTGYSAHDIVKYLATFNQLIMNLKFRSNKLK